MHERLKNEILGKEYSLSIALVSVQKSRELNRRYRKKDKPTNVLAFPYRPGEGEIVLCPTVVKKEARLRLKASGGQAKNLKRAYREWEAFLVIHALLHLKGLRHGSIMEKAEKKYYEQHLDRNRPRLGNHSGRNRRISKERKNP